MTNVTGFRFHLSIVSCAACETFKDADKSYLSRMVQIGGGYALLKLAHPIHHAQKALRLDLSLNQFAEGEPFLLLDQVKSTQESAPDGGCKVVPS